MALFSESNSLDRAFSKEKLIGPTVPLNVRIAFVFTEITSTEKQNDNLLVNLENNIDNLRANKGRYH